MIKSFDIFFNSENSTKILVYSDDRLSKDYVSEQKLEFLLQFFDQKKYCNNSLFQLRYYRVPEYLLHLGKNSLGTYKAT